MTVTSGTSRAFSFRGNGQMIECWPDSITREAAESFPELASCGMQVQWIGAALPSWVQPEADGRAEGIWSLLVVEDVPAFLNMPGDELSRTDEAWCIALIPDNEAGRSISPALQDVDLILWCPDNHIINISEDIAHFLLRMGVIGVDNSDIINCLGLEKGRCMEATAQCVMGKGPEAAADFASSWNLRQASQPLPWVVMGQFIQKGVQWSLQEVDDGAGMLLSHVDGPCLIKCLLDAPRTEFLIIAPTARLE